MVWSFGSGLGLGLGFWEFTRGGDGFLVELCTDVGMGVYILGRVGLVVL